MLIFIFLGLVGSAICRSVNEQMTLEQWANSFPTDGIQELKHEIVPIRTSHLQKRDLRGEKHIEFKAFGNDIKLWLNPVDDILVGETTPVYEVIKNPATNRIDIELCTDAMKSVREDLYENAQHAATVIINEIPNDIINFQNSLDYNMAMELLDERVMLKNQPTLTGYFGNQKLFIRPIPNNFTNQIKRMRRSVDDIPDSESDHYQYHMVYQLAGTPKTMKILGKPSNSSTKSKRSAYDTLYPEILLVVDHPLYKLFNEDVVDIVSYLLPFWNAVDMKFRSLEHPKFRLNIAAIIIAKSPDALPYIYNNKLNTNDLIVDAALEDTTRTFFSRITPVISSNDYDVVVTMTADRLCSYKNGAYICEHLGMSRLNGACKNYDGNNNAIMYDNSGYMGINTAAHELGHLFGARDIALNDTTCGVDGHLMTTKIYIDWNTSDWSNCSLLDIQIFLNYDYVKCLKNIPNVDKPIPQYLPGLLMSANEQCRKIFGPNSYANPKNRNICNGLYCYIKYDMVENPFYTISVPADGTECAEGKICLNSRCIDRIEAGI